MYGIFSSYLGRLAPNYHFSSTRYAPTVPIESSALNARTRDGISFRLAQLPEKSGTGDYPVIY